MGIVVDEINATLYPLYGEVPAWYRVESILRVGLHGFYLRD